MTLQQAANIVFLTESDFKKIEMWSDPSVKVVHREERKADEFFLEIPCGKYCYRCDNPFAGLVKSTDYTWPLLAASVGIFQIMMFALWNF